MGEDINSDLKFEEQEASPSFESREEEIANIAELNDDTVPFTASDDNDVPTYIDGKFSEKIIKNADDAIQALNDIHYIMRFENAEQEFEEVYSQSVPLGQTTNFYRLQQTYHNIPVYGYQLIVSTDEQGEIQALNGHYCPEIDIDINPSITMVKAKNIVENVANDSDNRSDGLYILAENKGEAALVWKIVTFDRDYFVDAKTGDIVKEESNIRDNNIGKGNDMAGNEKEFPVYYEDNQFYMIDDTRNIYMLEGNHSGSASLISASENTPERWSVFPEGISAYNNITDTYDYYANILGHAGADKNNIPTYIVVNYRQNQNEPYNNAFFTDSNPDKTLLCIGDYTNFAHAMDVIAHEFTHAVNNEIWSPEYINASGALDEAYVDIMAELIENERLEYLGEDLSSGTLRSFIKPSDLGDSDDYSSKKAFCYKNGHHDCNCNDPEDHRCDNGGVHSNSGIINHAAYLMDQEWPASNHSKELAALFYKSMYYMSSSTPNQDFLDCRYALLAASKSMGMSSEKRNVIATALSDVGVVNEDEEVWLSAHHIIGNVKDAQTGEPIIDAKIIAVATEGLGGGIGYSDGSGNYDVKINRAVYTVSVFADGYKSYTVENVDLSSWFEMNHYMETVYLTPFAGESEDQSGYASGKITNALTGEAIEGVRIKFRSGSNNKTGSYVQTVAGLDIELTTDSTGKYYTAALPAGNYTLEASKEGFVAEYINILSGNSSICENQNGSLMPVLQEGVTRIVLTWDENPRDLDSHVSGTLSNGNTFHVYYGHKSQYDGDIEACNLDVDDTTSYGPETITIKETTKQPYYYYIYNFAGSGTLSTSGAQIKVYREDRLVGTFNVPVNQGNERYWNVFAVVDGNIVVKNTMTSSPDVSYAANSRMKMNSVADNLQNKLMKEGCSAKK